ncbi:glycosyl transferase family 90-domain-containing protein [Mycena crocata]|nr:glycosyl transferase family 90-domain-containing protein [Mycena crocata]
MKAVASAEHRFRSDGLLELNPAGSHPIFELIWRAEAGWKDKLDRASTTFPQAVAEYKRRYSRDPPRGFDGWWNYVRENDVQLPDEYDQIYADLEPFWGIEQKDLLAIRDELESRVDSYTLGKTSWDSNVSVLNTSLSPAYNHILLQTKAAITLLQDIDHLLPPFRAVFTPDDAPNRLSDFSVKSAALQAATEKRYISRKDLPKTGPVGWNSACAPGSPGRNESINLEGPSPPKTTGKTFIYDHKLAMDPCLHPGHFWHHGQFIWKGKGPATQKEMVPEFAYSSTAIHHNIRLPTPYLWVEDIIPRSDDPEWEDKVDERLMWRGSTTGMMQRGDGANVGTRLAKAHRTRLVRFANDLKGAVSLLPPVKSNMEAMGEPVAVLKSRLNPAVLDVAFTGEPILCGKDLCSRLKNTYTWRDPQSIKEAGNYKYVLDIDGNGWSARFKRLLTSNSLIFKATLYPDWYSDRIAPWVHYIPVQLDLSDLHDAFLFFRGDLRDEGAHEDLARKIAAAGRVWSKTFWRQADMHAYFYRLILEYARLMSEDREAMSYKE